MTEWNGQERRSDMLDFKVFMKETNMYREALCKKMEELKFEMKDVKSWLISLPCKERAEMYKGLSLTIKLIFTAIGITFGILVAHMGWK